MKFKYKRKCEVCGKELKTMKSKQKVCSIKCYQELLKRKHYWKKYYQKHREQIKTASAEWYIKNVGIKTPRQVKCKNCKKIFQSKKISHIFCSKKCRDKARKKQRKRYNKKYWADRYVKKPQVEKKCLLCNRKFMSNNPNHKYCGDECRFIISRALSRAYNQKKYVKKPQVEKKCLLCNRKFMSNNPIVKFCSKKCSLLYQKQWRKDYYKQYNK